MRKIVFLNAVFGLVGSTAFWACGDTSADSVSADSQIKADALEDLPNCYEKHEAENESQWIFVKKNGNIF